MQSGGPAEGAGIATGDVIVSVNGKTVGSPDDVSATLNGSGPGDHVKVVWTDTSGQQHQATVTLAAGPPA